MPEPKLSALELRIMSELWSRGPCSIREIHEAVAKRDKPAYTTVQTMVYRLEAKGALRRTKRSATHTCSRPPPRAPRYRPGCSRSC